MRNKYNIGRDAFIAGRDHIRNIYIDFSSGNFLGGLIGLTPVLLIIVLLPVVTHGSGQIINVFNSNKSESASENRKSSTESSSSPLNKSKPKIPSENFEKADLTVQCESSSPGKFKDLEITSCGHNYGNFVISGRNFSKDWYEIERKVGGKLVGSLVEPGEKFSVAVNTPRGYSQRLEQEIYNSFMEAPKKSTIPIEDFSIQLKKYSGNPVKNVTISCNEKLVIIWNVEFTPTCRSEGSFIDVLSISNSTMTVSVGEKMVTYGPGAYPKGTISSSDSVITFTVAKDIVDTD